MERRKRRKYSAEFKAEAVRLVHEGKRTVHAVSKELGVPDTVLRDWVMRAEADAGKSRSGALTTAERQELSELRRKVQRLEMEKEILKKAAAFFAKENG